MLNNVSSEQGKETLKSIMDALDMCNPNVILVEKTVSRDIQESILAKGMTLVIDMKLHRLQRVARCTGSSILSSDTLTGKKLGQCDSFHFAKFVEEHATAGESGKKPSKTLMFLDGCPTRLGCTVSFSLFLKCTSGLSHYLTLFEFLKLSGFLLVVYQLSVVMNRIKRNRNINILKYVCG